MRNSALSVGRGGDVEIVSASSPDSADGFDVCSVDLERVERQIPGPTATAEAVQRLLHTAATLTERVDGTDSAAGSAVVRIRVELRLAAVCRVVVAVAETDTARTDDAVLILTAHRGGVGEKRTGRARED